jgi:hypothetical protein
MVSAMMKMGAPMTPVMPGSVLINAMPLNPLNHAVGLIQSVLQIPSALTLWILITMASPTVKTTVLKIPILSKKITTMTHTVMLATIAL